jgi:hypothetical protein
VLSAMCVGAQDNEDVSGVACSREACLLMEWTQRAEETSKGSADCIFEIRESGAIREYKPLCWD